MAGDTPEFGSAPSFISAVQMIHEVSEDKKAIGINFSNFGAALVPRGSPVAMQTLSVVLPLKNMQAGARITGGVLGNGVMDPGTRSTLIFRAAGVSLAFDQLFAPGEDGFTKEINLPVPPGEDLRITIIVALEGSPTDPNAEAAVNVTALDLELAPGEPELNV